jgi:MraZ protein
MFRGCYTARIDEKGRLKVPSDFRRLVEEHFGRDVFGTSLDGRCVRVYPMRTWLELEEKLGGTGVVRDPSTHRFFQRTNYFGQTAEIDNQGRVLIHPRLRDAADMSGDVDVVGNYDYLEVWNHTRMAEKVDQEPFTDEDMWVLVKGRS